MSQTVEGLSSPVVLSVFKDSRGFMWFGTNSGLYRYDGYEFKLFQSDPGDTTTISNATIWRILCEDKNGYLWIASIDQVLNRYDFQTNKFRRYNLKSMVTNQKRWIDKAYPDTQGNIWFIPNDFGLINYSRSTDNFSKSYPDPDEIKSKQNIITSVIEGKSGTFYVFSKEGNFILNRETNIYTPFIVEDSPTNFQHAEILESLEDKHGILWFGTNKGFFKYSKDINKIEYILYQKSDLSLEGDNPLYYWFYMNPLDEGNTYWIKNDLGMNKFDPSDESFSLYTLQPDDQLSYYTDSWGSYGHYLDESAKLWLATDISGVKILELKDNLFRSFQIKSNSDKPEYFNASSFLKDSQNNVWVGTNYGGLLQYDRSMNLKKRFINEFGTLGILNDVSSLMYSIYEDSDGIIWLGTWGLGLVLYDISSETMLQCLANAPPGSLNKYMRIGRIVEDKQKTIWVGTNNGLYYLRKKHRIDTSFNKITKVPVGSSWIRNMCEDNTGSIWVATDADGLFCVTKDQHDSITYKQYLNDPQNPNSLSSNSVFSVYNSGDEFVWIGSIAGLDCFSLKDKSFTRYNSQDGFFADMVYDIEGDGKGFLWMSTNNGLVRYNPKDGGLGLRSKQFTTKDGLPFDNIFPYVFYCSSDGEIFCGGRRGTDNGFFYFQANKVQDNTDIPPIVITHFKVRNEEYSLDTNINIKKHIMLKHDQNYFSFDFAALDYTDPEKNHYAYMLEGLDEDWIYSGTRRFANYTGIPSGDYVFRVKGSNNDGYWNEAGTAISIHIQTPPWKTWWAYALYGLFIVGVFYLIMRYYLKRQQLLHQLSLEHIQTEKLEELDRMKSRFFANISHEFRTPLTLILGPLEKLKIKSVDKESEQDLNIMQRNARRLQNLINQLLNLSKLESGQMKLQAREENIVSLVNGYMQSFESLAKQKKIDLLFKSSEKEIPLFVDKDKIEKILYNLLSNAFKFTGEGGKIEVEVTPLATPLRGENSMSLIDAESSNGNAPFPLQGGTRGVEIKISDTGCGIPPEKLEHIFDRFYQTDDNYTKDQEGTGIGLALTKELVELHYGRIAVESQPGSGTTFTVFLPLGKDHLKPGEIVDQAVPEGKIEDLQESYVDLMHQENVMDDENEKDNSKPLLLIVEDNNDLRSYIRSCLVSEFRLSEAIDGETGFIKAVDKIPDLIVSDVMMPKMDGIELCRKLKTDERTSHIPVILLTAKAALEDRIEGLETGADDFLTKPFNPDELLVRIRNLINQRDQLRKRFIKEFAVHQEVEEKQELSRDQKFLLKVKELVEENLSDPDFSVEILADRIALSRYQVHRKLRALLDQSATDFIRTVRLNRAAILLAKKTATVAEIAYDVGFNNPSYFAECFRKQFGKLPSEYTG